MSTAIFQRKANAMARKNNGMRRAFALDGVRCFLMKRDGQSKRCVQLLELITGWRIKFDNNRAESGLFRYATADIDAVRDIWASSSAVGYGVPNAGTIEVYTFADGEKDKIDPDGSSVYFAGRIVRMPNERHTIIEAP